MPIMWANINTFKAHISTSKIKGFFARIFFVVIIIVIVVWVCVSLCTRKCVCVQTFFAFNFHSEMIIFFCSSFVIFCGKCAQSMFMFRVDKLSSPFFVGCFVFTCALLCQYKHKKRDKHSQVHQLLRAQWSKREPRRFYSHFFYQALNSIFQILECINFLLSYFSLLLTRPILFLSPF